MSAKTRRRRTKQIKRQLAQSRDRKSAVETVSTSTPGNITRPKPGSASFKWWLCDVEQKTACNNVQCHGHRILKPGDQMVVRYIPKEFLCVACADERGIPYKPSRRWEERHTKTIRLRPREARRVH